MTRAQRAATTSPERARVRIACVDSQFHGRSGVVVGVAAGELLVLLEGERRPLRFGRDSVARTSAPAQLSDESPAIPASAAGLETHPAPLTAEQVADAQRIERALSRALALLTAADARVRLAVEPTVASALVRLQRAAIDKNGADR